MQLFDASPSCCRISSASTNDEGSGSRKRRSKPPARVALFRHVRFNRVHVSITYKGTYFSLTNAKVTTLCISFDAADM